MTDKVSKARYQMRILGAAVVVSAAMPLSAVVAEAATPSEKLSALRAAVQSDLVELSTDSGVPAEEYLKLTGDDGFSDRAPTDDPPPSPGP
jgi:hypothetical protein